MTALIEQPLPCRSPSGDSASTLPGSPAAPPLPGLALQLASAEVALGDIAHLCAHDLRTPLRHVISYADLLREAAQSGAVGADAAAWMRKITDAAQRLQQLLDDLTALARVRSSGLQTGPVDMAALAQAAWDEVSATVGGSAVAWQLPHNLPMVTGHAALLREVWRSLMAGLLQAARSVGPSVLQVSAQPVAGGLAFDLRLQPVAPAGWPGSAALAERDGQSFRWGAQLALVRPILGSHDGRLRMLAPTDEGAGIGLWLPG